jgi:hypothetical protein
MKALISFLLLFSTSLSASPIPANPARGPDTTIICGWAGWNPEPKVEIAELDNGSYAIQVSIRYHLPPHNTGYAPAGLFVPSLGVVVRDGDSLVWKLGRKSIEIGRNYSWTTIPYWSLVSGVVQVSLNHVDGTSCTYQASVNFYAD